MLRAILAVLISASAGAAEHPSAPFFKLLDRSADGVVRPEEVAQSPWVKRLDVDSDGGVTPEELAAGWDKFPALRAGLASRFPEALGYPSTPPVRPADESPRQGPKILAPASAGIGTFIPDLAVQVIGGGARPLSSFTAGKPLVIANASPSCPISKRYAATLLSLQKEYPTAAFLFLATNQTDSDAALREALPGATMARDPSGTLLRALGAKSSTDTFVLDARRTLQYRGAVDDQYGLGYSLEAPRVRYLANALTSVLTGRGAAIAATEAPGCELDLSTAEAAPVASATFHNRISRLLQQHCQECHRKGGVAPFALETYEEVSEHAGMIKKMVAGRLMPPWFAAPPRDGEHSPWLNDRSLPPEERTAFLAWLASGRALGDEKDAPFPRNWPVNEWSIGTPDAVFQIPAPIAVKATGTMPYQQVRVATQFSEARFVSAVEVLPTARDVVHHVLVFADDGGGRLERARRVLESRLEGRSRADDESGGFFGIYVPGNNVLEYPEGFARELPAGATLRFQIHYTPNGKETTDQVRIGLKFAPERPRHIVHNAGISNRRFSIPPGVDNHSVEARLPIPRDAVILAFLPHMHVRGKAWRYEVITPGAAARTLLDVPRYDFNWQLLYRFAEPLRIPAGSTLQATAWYDNSTANPANPDPTQVVRWGPQTSDEMMLGYVEYYLPSEAPGGTDATR
jgi:hypothetical protein